MKSRVMKIMIPVLVGTATSAFAATINLEQVGAGPIVWFFIGFAVMLLIAQAMPAMLIFFSMLKGLFSTNPAESSFSPWKGKDRS